MAANKPAPYPRWAEMVHGDEMESRLLAEGVPPEIASGIGRAFTNLWHSKADEYEANLDQTSDLIRASVSSVETHSHDGTESAALDHGDLAGLGGDDHPDLLNETRHDLLDHAGLDGVGSGGGSTDDDGPDLSPYVTVDAGGLLTVTVGWPFGIDDDGRAFYRGEATVPRSNGAAIAVDGDGRAYLRPVPEGS